jgi:hypothetical protein
MAQSLELNIKTTSDVPQAMNKAKQATDGFGKQVQGIQKKFSMAFKDVFLSFLGPLALLGIAMNYIGKLIDENKKKHEDANRAAIEGTNALMSAEDKYWANKRNNEKKAKETVEEAETAREDVTLSFLQNDPRGKEMVNKILSSLPPGMVASAAFNTAGNMSKQKDVQDKVQAMIAEDIKTNPLAASALKDSEAKSANFKGPEGFSNVVGVGANPVIEAMNAQLEATQETNAILREIANGGGASTDFTKANSSPSRASLLIR